MSDDQSLNLLLSEADRFENGEERRLFYVAMTRARERVYFLAHEQNKSKFITELETEHRESASRSKCPRCKTGELVARSKGTSKKGYNYTFMGCSNYLYGCEHNDKVWEPAPGLIIS
ncbi:3'-5' exonuclease [Rufibacter quisquiliarum]|uniref:ATP-dependent exoDNAse (Exonuclease V) beta subunit n=1 Tax=Rufibacter quisquiliarum TaxID=1549639 RepID=A0A839GDT4_9BACT|nr:3'-5' exonuclease [Rufibacter quisquiliarum]MBA9077072.1 ATP-dependent exoDNAse (exonuclease V) beta subunit [Rufibacter quisquiliarum]